MPVLLRDPRLFPLSAEYGGQGIRVGAAPGPLSETEWPPRAQARRRGSGGGPSEHTPPGHTPPGPGRGAEAGGGTARSLPAGPLGPRPGPRCAEVGRAFAVGRRRRCAAHRVQRDLVRHILAATFPPLPDPPRFAAFPLPLPSASTRLRHSPRALPLHHASGLDGVTTRPGPMTTTPAKVREVWQRFRGPTSAWRRPMTSPRGERAVQGACAHARRADHSKAELGGAAEQLWSLGGRAGWVRPWPEFLPDTGSRPPSALPRTPGTPAHGSMAHLSAVRNLGVLPGRPDPTSLLGPVAPVRTRSLQVPLG